MPNMTSELPGTGDLVSVRGQKWVVAFADPQPHNTLVELQSVEDGRYGDTLSIIWEVEPNCRVLPAGALPEVASGDFDPPSQLAAFLDAIRWSAVTSADVRTLQAPFRSGVAIEDYQLEPVARAVDAPRANLLLADDVGLGKTVEAGLVAQELLLRHRAHRIMIVCPAGLTVKWRDEMAEKFGLDFTIIDAERCAQVRRSHGSAANPFEVYPLCIVSLPWLRGPKGQRLLAEVLPPGGAGYQRRFDLLILDEAHHVAPAAPKQIYAVDSQQTKLIRWLAPHFTHRLFLSATPHNGYPESFTALLEILDDQRFARGVTPDKAAVKDTVIRRLKRDIVDADGTHRFVERQASALSVEYPGTEREVHALLSRFAELRRKRITSRRGAKATDLVTLLLKKRLFSSPRAFAHTIGVYMTTLQERASQQHSEASDEVEPWMDELFDEFATYDDEQLATAEDDAIDRTRPMQPDATDNEMELLQQMERWALEHEAEPDAKARRLINYLTAVCKPDGEHWTNERVVVFTEYRDTQLWLAELLRQEGLGGDEVAQLHGGVSVDEREQLRLAFQADPTEHRVRILLATDAASEGIDLQNHCHRLVNYDIPFNPNKLEQRIGRIDRYGQRVSPEIRHFVGTGFGKTVDPFEADLEFLSRVANKVARMEADLGPINAVLSDAVQRRMLGEQVSDTEIEQAGKAKENVPVESNVGEQVRRLRANLDETVTALGITPTSVKRVVDTALVLARQQPLTPHTDDRQLAEGMLTVPTLTGSWQRASAGLTEKLRRDGEVPRQLPVTFDASVAKGRDDVVLAHLNHPLVAMSTRLLRAAVSTNDIGLHRVTAVLSDDPALEDVLVGAYSRFVLVGADGVRLHEEVLYAGGWAPENGRFRRLENLKTLDGFLSPALAAGVPASGPVTERLASRWPRIRDAVYSSVTWRSQTRRESLQRKLDQRREAERERITANLDQFAATLRGALHTAEDDGLFRLEQLKSKEEQAQYRKDRESWEQRLKRLGDERERELAAIDARYRDPKDHLFPVAVVFVLPRREATR